MMGNNFKDIYRGKKVLITGHTGFKGGWLSLWLTLLGAKVIGFSLAPSTEPNFFEVVGLENKMTSIIGDIRDKKAVESLIAEQKPDFIFHLAAQPLVRLSYKEPVETFETNIMGTINLFESVRKNNLECVFVNVTSDKCYENIGDICNFKETDPMGGYDPYSASKGAAEIVTSAYRNSFFNPKDYGIKHRVAMASGRAGNVIGGGDWSADRLIPDIARALSKNEEIIIRNPNAVRPWQHVMECVGGYLHLGMKLAENPTKFAEGWNFGPDGGEVRTVEQILVKSLELWGSGKYQIIPDKNMKEADYLRLDITKAKELLGWKPVYNVDKAVEITINWYKSFYSGAENMYEMTKKQLEEYSSATLISVS
jgi:CDP-glucose 4,6-dehydratase